MSHNPETHPKRKRAFLSDLHLRDADGPHLRRFGECVRLESLWADEIFILGDLFDAWAGDDEDSPLAETVCAALRTASANAKLHFMPGNRDFLCGQGFAKRSGAQLLPDPFQTADGLILTHGDALCTDDAAYQALRRHFRSQTWQKEFLSRPLAERRALAASVRTASEAAKANKPEAITDVNQGAVERLLVKCKGQVLIHGHTHRPGLHRSPVSAAGGRIRYVLGDWARCGWLLRQCGQRFQLECFPVQQPYAGPSKNGNGLTDRDRAVSGMGVAR